MKSFMLFLCGLLVGYSLQYGLSQAEKKECDLGLSKEHSVKVKRSLSGLCHSQESHYFDYIKSYTEYDNLSQCVLEGGSLPVKLRNNSSK